MKNLLILNGRQRDGSYKTSDRAYYRARYVFAINEDHFMVLKDRDGLFLEYQGVKNSLQDLPAFKNKIKKFLSKKTPPNTAAIKSLKQQGWNLKIKHFRRKAFKDKTEPLIADSTIRSLRSIFPDFSYGIVSQTGGATEIVLEKGEQKIIVRADCYVKDHFCKRLGTKAVLDKLKKLYDIGA